MSSPLPSTPAGAATVQPPSASLQSSQTQLEVAIQADYSKLPRSVIWRLLLGLLQSPSSSRANQPVLLEQVLQCNREQLQEEVSHYEQLQALYQPHLEEQKELMDASPTATEVEDTTPTSNTTAAAADPLIDPLTAMMMEQQAQEDRKQELDLRYRKEKARRNRGLVDPNNKVIEDDVDDPADKKLDRETLSIIDKDLKRLPSPDVTEVVEGGVSIHTKWNTPQQQQIWVTALREILYIYAQEQPHIGYRQGMHEVASYLWLVLVMDRQRLALKTTATTTTSNDDSQEELLALVFDRPAVYILLKSILGHVRQAFDVKVASNSRPLEDMSHSILHKLQQYFTSLGRPDQISPLLNSLSVPPQLYCTKWIRLLFSREVTGASTTILLWDVFVELVSEGWEWMAILETTAASRILLYQDVLLKGQGQESVAAHHHRVMDLLMNMPPLDNIEPLVKQLNELLELQKYQQLHPESVQKPIIIAATDNSETAAKAAPHATMNHSQQQQQQQYPMQQQQHHHYPHANNTSNGNHPNRMGNNSNKIGADLFNLQAVKQSWEQGVEKLSSNTDNWRKKLEEGWNGFTQQPSPGQQQQQGPHQDARNFMMDPSLFADDDVVDVRRQNSPYGHATPPPPPPSVPHQRPPPHPQGYLPTQTNGVPNNNPTSAATPLMALNNAPGVATHQGARPGPHHRQQQNNHQLAYRLGNSAAMLQDFVMNVARTPDPQQYPLMMMNGGPNAAAAPTKVPNAVWEALAEIEAVRTILLQQQQQK